MNAMSSRAMNQYKQVGTRVTADTADPHQLIVMLFDGALERIAIAKGAIDRNDIELKGSRIGSAIDIIDGLKASLDMDKGGDIAANLTDLYSYMQRRLLEANVESSISHLNEVAGLINEVKSAWVAMPVEERVVANA